MTTIPPNSNNKTNKTTSDTDGLPDIAQDKNKNITGASIVFAALLVLGGGWILQHHYSQNTNNGAQPGEETFTIEKGAPTQSTPQQIEKAKTASQEANNPPAPSPEMLEAQQKALLQRLQAPMMVVSNQASSTENNRATKGNNLIADPNTAFLNQASTQDVEVAQASVLQHPNTLIAQGNLIIASLESAINSDLPGFIRAIVAEPVYSEDGSQVLVQPGSRLIGQYKSGMITGQSRVFIVWTRLITTKGVSVSLGSPGVDNLGVAGQGADYVDRHFWQMFGTASLLSIIGAGASNVGVHPNDQYNASQSYRQAISQSFAQSANNSLQQNGTIAPTLHINQGQKISVFVAKDLDFSKAVKQTGSQVNIF